MVTTCRFTDKSWRLSANFDVPGGGANGTIATLGGPFDGWALRVQDRKPVFRYTFGDVVPYAIVAPDALRSDLRRDVVQCS